MISVGNHEEEFMFGFQSVVARFKMPNNSSSLSTSHSPFWYSFNYANIHVITISTEHSLDVHSIQFKWLEDDLAKAKWTM